MRRFYRHAATLAANGGFGVALDGRLVKTPARRDLVVPGSLLAAAIAAEWNAQGAELRRSTMLLTRLADLTIDRDPPLREALVSQTANYAGTDLVCYRTADQPPLAARQDRVWQPLLDWAALRYGAPLAVTAGVIPAHQPPASLIAYAAVVAAQDDFALTALHSATAACGSLVIALALVEGRLDAEAAFAAAQLDESFQIEAWGEDEEQRQRRQGLAAEIAAAARFFSLLRAGGPILSDSSGSNGEMAEP
jgi:chaperone required for assembly of F1-ATPase